MRHRQITIQRTGDSGYELPEEAVKVGDNIDLEDVYLYYYE